VAEVIRRMTIGEAPEPLPKQQVIGLDYEALFTNLSDDTFNCVIFASQKKVIYTQMNAPMI